MIMTKKNTEYFEFSFGEKREIRFFESAKRKQLR